MRKAPHARSCAIEQSQRPLPIGYWKVQAFHHAGHDRRDDIVASYPSAFGRSLLEAGISQVFLAINPAALGTDRYFRKSPTIYRFFT